ncbi:hypothetical protein D3C85_1009750 [compost metagenome]
MLFYEFNVVNFPAIAAVFAVINHAGCGSYFWENKFVACFSAGGHDILFVKGNTFCGFDKQFFLCTIYLYIGVFWNADPISSRSSGFEV